MPKTSKRAIQAPPTDSLDYGRKRSQWRDVLHRLTRNKLAMLGLVIVLVLVLAAVFADFVAPYDPDVQDYTNMKAYPSFAHPLGTDDVGRDNSRIQLYWWRRRIRWARTMWAGTPCPASFMAGGFPCWFPFCPLYSAWWWAGSSVCPPAISAESMTA